MAHSATSSHRISQKSGMVDLHLAIIKAPSVMRVQGVVFCKFLK